MLADLEVICLHPLLRILKHEPNAVGAATLEQFSALATRTVPLILAAGVGILIVILPGPGALLTPYGSLVLAKLAAFALLMGLAALNKWRFLPDIAAGRDTASRSLQRAMLSEWILLTAVIVLTAVMTSFFSPDV